MNDINSIYILNFSLNNIEPKASDIKVKEGNRGDLLVVCLDEDIGCFDRFELWYKNFMTMDKANFVEPKEIKSDKLVFSLDDVIAEDGIVELELNCFTEDNKVISSNITTMTVSNTIGEKLLQ